LPPSSALFRDSDPRPRISAGPSVKLLLYPTSLPPAARSIIFPSIAPVLIPSSFFAAAPSLVCLPLHSAPVHTDPLLLNKYSAARVSPSGVSSRRPPREPQSHHTLQASPYSPSTFISPPFFSLPPVPFTLLASSLRRESLRSEPFPPPLSLVSYCMFPAATLCAPRPNTPLSVRRLQRPRPPARASVGCSPSPSKRKPEFLDRFRPASTKKPSEILERPVGWLANLALAALLSCDFF